MYTDNLLLHITMQFLTMPEVEKTTNRVGGGGNQRKEKKSLSKTIFEA